MKKNLVLLLMMATLALTGCSQLEEPIEVSTTTQARTRVGYGGTLEGKTVLVQGYTYNYEFIASYSPNIQRYKYPKWQFGKLDEAGKFVEIKDGITVNSSNIREYNITVNVAPGDYIVKVSISQNPQLTGWLVGDEISVTVESTLQRVVTFKAYKRNFDNSVWYLEEGSNVAGYTYMGDNYSFRAFKTLPPEENVYSKKLMPVYYNGLKDNSIVYNMYTMIPSTDPRGYVQGIAFYILSSPQPLVNCTPLYLMAEAMYVGSLDNRPIYDYRNTYFATFRQSSVSSLQNKGIVGYTFALK